MEAGGIGQEGADEDGSASQEIICLSWEEVFQTAGASQHVCHAEWQVEGTNWNKDGSHGGKPREETAIHEDIICQKSQCRRRKDTGFEAGGERLNEGDNWGEEVGVQSVVDKHQKLQEKVQVDGEYASWDKTKPKDHIQNNNNIDLSDLEELKQ